MSIDGQSLKRFAFRVSREIDGLDCSATLCEYQGVCLTYDPNPFPRIVFENRDGEVAEVYSDGSILSKIENARLPVAALYLAVHVLTNVCNRAMPRGCNVDTVLPRGVCRNAFWGGDIDVGDVGDATIDLSDVEDPFEPGVLEPGSVVPFSVAAETLVDERRLPTNPRMPIFFVRTPLGFHVSRNVFEIIGDADAVAFFTELRAIVERRSKNKMHRASTYAYSRPANQLYVKNGEFTSDAYLLYATMGDAVFDEERGTFDLQWTALPI